MTDREPSIPADLTRPLNFRPQVDLLVGDLSPNSHVETAQRGDSTPMPLTLAPRHQLRSIVTDDSSATFLRAWLTQIAASTANLTPFCPAILPGSHSRSPLEAEAVARAAGCPDLFVIHATEQSSRERAIVDIAGATGSERVLVLSPDAMTVDRIVERLLKSGVSAVRALADDENPARPSPVVTRSTTASVATLHLERLRSEATTAVACAAERLNAIDEAIRAQAQVGMLTKRCVEIDMEIADVNVRRERIEPQVQLEARGTEGSAFATIVNGQKSEQQVAIDGIIQKQTTKLEIYKAKEAILADLRKQANETVIGAAKKSGFFSRLIGRTKSSPLPNELDKQLRDAELELNEIAETISTLQRDLQIASSKLEEESERLIQAEVSIRRAELDAKLSLLITEFGRLKSELENAKRALGPNPIAPMELADVKAAAERELLLAQKRAAEQPYAERDLVKRILAESRVVVGIPGSLQSDPVFERNPHDLPSCQPFGLLVLDRAEELTEHDFVRLSKLASRWVFLGDVAIPDETRAYLRGISSRHLPGFGRNGRAIEIPFTARMAHALDRERWIHETDRLVCRLAHLNLDEWRKVVREPLLDSPDIELRFKTEAEGEPVLVEVAFPLSTSIAAAKSFLYRQLGEILLRPCGDVGWHSTADLVTATWPTVDRASKVAEAVWIELESGVREKIIGVGIAAFTAAITFDTALGWNAANAEKWLQEHLDSASISRFATITRR